MSNEFLLALNAAFYLGAIYYCMRKKVHIVVSFILVLYFLSAVGSIFLIGNSYFEDGKGTISFYPLIYLFLMIVLMMKPLTNLRNSFYIEEPNFGVLRIVIIVTIIVALPRAIQALLNFDEVIYGLMMDATTADVIEGVSIYDKKSGGGFNYLSILGGAAFALAPLLLMYYISLKRTSKFLIAMLVLVSIAASLEETAKGGRGALVNFMMCILFLYILLRPIYPPKTKRTIIVFGSGIFAVLLGVFYLVTMFKHGYLDEDARQVRTLGYISQNYIIFDSYGLDAGGVRYGTRTATMITKLVDPSSPSTYAERVSRFNHMKINESKFSTFVGDYTLDFGPIITALLFIIFSAVFTNTLKNKGQIPFYKLFLIFFLMKLLLFGLFLSPYCNLGGNLQILVFFVLYEFFKLNRKQSLAIAKNISS